MLVSSQIVKTPSVERLLRLWANRYTVNISSLSIEKTSYYEDLLASTSPKGRALTMAKLRQSIVDVKCQMAGIQAKSLYEYIPNIVNLEEAQRLTKFAYKVYQKLLEIYQQQSDNDVSSASRVMALGGGQERFSLSLWGIPDIEQLAIEIEPILLEFQEQYRISKNWRALGFITTQFNFCNQLLIYKFTPIEKVLIGPYFQFIEEQVALPWQRICAAAANHTLDSPAFILVEQMFPAASEISETVYRRMKALFPNHHSRRGGLSDPGITHSCLRDLTMFQAYLWLSVLESSLTVVEQELVPVCVMVMDATEVKWELIEKWNELLADEIIKRVQPKQRQLLMPYIQGIERALLKGCKHLEPSPAQELLEGKPAFLF